MKSKWNVRSWWFVVLVLSGFLITGCPPTGAPDEGDDITDGNDDDSTPPATQQKQDLWTTNKESSSVQDFSSSPLPAGFFNFDGRSCDAFSSATSFVGAAISENTTGAADTIVTRDGDPLSPSDPVGAIGSVGVQITNLNLHASSPIVVLCDGEPTNWNVQATLSDTPSPKGSLSAVKTHDNGGTAETTLPVLLKLTFKNVEDPSVRHVLDFAENGLDPVEFHAEMTWVHRIDPTDSDEPAGFIVGVASGPEAAKMIAQGKAGPRLQGGQTLIACAEHDNPGGTHLHNTCTADSDSDGVPDGVDNCRFLLNPDQEDRDGDLFGDLCDPCPDDPECPQGGDECETVCEEVYDDLVELYEELFPLFCEWIECTSCFPPCDPEVDSDPAECSEILESFSALTEESLCLYTRFTGWGCDRCVLPPFPALPCPDPCETTSCPAGSNCIPYYGCVEDIDLCEFAFCPEGQGCDSETGQCCENPSGGCPFDLCAFTLCLEGEGCDPETGRCCENPSAGCPMPAYNPCDFVSCPTGAQCNPATAQCWNPETGECFGFEYLDPCESADCGPDEVCDPFTGECYSLEVLDPCAEVLCAEDEYCDPITGECLSFDFNICDFITCPDGQVCDPDTGLCE